MTKNYNVTGAQFNLAKQIINEHGDDTSLHIQELLYHLVMQKSVLADSLLEILSDKYDPTYWINKYKGL